MEESVINNEASPISKLALFSLPSHHHQQSELPGMLTPPLLTSVSVPFQWEEAPGKPRHSGELDEEQHKAKCVRSLELPPRLFLVTNINTNEGKVTKMPSPTAVLDGPEMGRSSSFSYALRSPNRELTSGGGGGGGGGSSGRFGSKRWAGLKRSKEGGGGGEGGFEFLCGGDDGCDRTKVKITRVRRKASFFHGANASKSHLWTSIYESLKQVVPWRRRQEKLRKSATVGFEPQNSAPISTC